MSIIRNYWILEDDGRSRLFSPLSIAIKLPIFGILIFRKIKFFEEICQFRLRKLLLNYPSRFEVLITNNNVTHGNHDLFLWVRWFTHPGDMADKFSKPVNYTGLMFSLLRDEP